MLQLPTGKSRHPPGVMKRGPLKGVPKACSGTCEVLALAMRYEKLVSAYNKTTTDEQHDSLWSKMNAIAERASRMTARSFDGSAFQIMLAAGMLSTIRSGATGDMRVEHEERAERLLYRAMDRIGDMNGPGWEILRAWLMHADDKKSRRSRRTR